MLVICSSKSVKENSIVGTLSKEVFKILVPENFEPICSNRCPKRQHEVKVMMLTAALKLISMISIHNDDKMKLISTDQVKGLCQHLHKIGFTKRRKPDQFDLIEILFSIFTYLSKDKEFARVGGIDCP